MFHYTKKRVKIKCICIFLQPRLADTRRSAIHCADMDIEYYRLRSFSITSHGICNLGDSMRFVLFFISEGKKKGNKSKYLYSYLIGFH